MFYLFGIGNIIFGNSICNNSKFVLIEAKNEEELNRRIFETNIFTELFQIIELPNNQKKENYIKMFSDDIKIFRSELVFKNFRNFEEFKNNMISKFSEIKFLDWLKETNSYTKLLKCFDDYESYNQFMRVIKEMFWSIVINEFIKPMEIFARGLKDENSSCNNFESNNIFDKNVLKIIKNYTME
jgi:hypothetical protein